MPNFPFFSTLSSIGCFYLGHHLQEMAREDQEKVQFFEKLPLYTVNELGREFDSHPQLFTGTAAPPIQCMVHGYTVQKAESLVCANREQSIDKFVTYLNDKDPSKTLPTATHPFNSLGLVETPIYVPKEPKPLNKLTDEMVYNEFKERNLKNTPSIKEFLTEQYEKRLKTSPYVNPQIITTAAVKLSEFEVFNTIVPNTPLNPAKKQAPGTLPYKIQTDLLEIGSLWIGNDVKVVDKFEANRFHPVTNVYIPRYSASPRNLDGPEHAEARKRIEEARMFPKYYITLPAKHIPLSLCELQNTVDQSTPLDIDLVFHSDNSLIQVNKPIPVGVQYQEHTVLMRQPITMVGEFFRNPEDPRYISIRPMEYNPLKTPSQVDEHPLAHLPSIYTPGTSDAVHPNPIQPTAADIKPKRDPAGIRYNPVITLEHLTKDQIMKDFREESDQFVKMSKISYTAGGLFGCYALGSLSYSAVSALWGKYFR